MSNFVEQLEQHRKTINPYAITLHGKFIRKLCSTYYNTGKESSKFFPVLNYAAAKIMPVSVLELEGCKDEAMKWVNDNISCAIVSYLPISLSNASIFVFKFFENSAEHVKQDMIHTHEKMIFSTNEDIFGRTTIMQSSSVRLSDEHISAIIYEIINSIEYMSSGLFDEHLNKVAMKVSRMPNKVVMLRLLKEQMTRERQDSHVGFPLISAIVDMQKSKSKNTYLFPLKSIDLLESASFCVYNSADDECILFKDGGVYNILKASTKELALNGLWVSSAKIDEIMGKYNSTYDMLTKNLSTITQQRDMLAAMAAEGKRAQTNSSSNEELYK